MGVYTIDNVDWNIPALMLNVVYDCNVTIGRCEMNLIHFSGLITLTVMKNGRRVFDIENIKILRR